MSEKPKFVFGATARTGSAGRATGGGKIKFGASSTASVKRLGFEPPTENTPLAIKQVELPKLSLGTAPAEFFRNLAALVVGKAGVGLIKFAMHSIRGILSIGAGNYIDQDTMTELAEKLLFEAKQTEYGSFQFVSTLLLVTKNSELVGKYLTLLGRADVPGSHFALAALIRQSSKEPAQKCEDECFSSVDDFLEHVSRMVLGEFGKGMKEIGKQCVRGILFGGGDNQIGLFPKHNLVTRLVDKVKDETDGESVAAALCLVAENDRLVEDGLKQLASGKGRGAAWKAFGWSIEMILGVGEVLPDSILSCRDEETARHVLEVYGGKDELRVAVERCLLHENLWRDAARVVQRPTLELILKIVSEKGNWREIVLWYAPGLEKGWGLGKRKAVKQALEITRAEDPTGSSPFNERVLDAGMASDVEWVDVTERAKKLIRGSMMNRKSGVAEKKKRALLHSKEADAGEMVYRSTMRELYLNGLNGRVLAIKGSGVLRVLDIADLVGEIEGFLWDAGKKRQRDEAEMQAVGLRRKWMEMESQVRPPVEWWAAFENNVTMLNRVVKKKRLNGEEVDMSEILYAATLGSAPLAAKYAIANGAVADPPHRGSKYCVVSTRNFPLFFAVENGDAEILDVLLQGGAGVERRNEGGSTPLILASKSGREECVRLLLEAGAEVNSVNREDQAGLDLAAFHGHSKCVAMLLESGANVDRAKTNGNTALILASQKGNVECVRKLVEAGANLDLYNKAGVTALIWAASIGAEGIVRILVNGRADLNLAKGKSYPPLICATYRGHDGCVRALVEAGANANVHSTKTGKTALVLAALKGDAACLRELLPVSEDVESALFAASSVGRVESLRVLVEGGADLQAVRNGETALSMAIRNKRVESVRFLLESGVDPKKCNAGNDSALVLACKCGFRECIRCLVESGAGDVNAVDGDGRPALLVVASRGNLKCLQVLFDLGVDVNAVDGDGKTALLTAVERGNREVICALIEAGADVNIADRDGDTPMHAAVRVGRIFLVRDLLRASVNLSACDGKGWTALHSAVRHKWAAGVEILLDAGADVNAKSNQRGLTPLLVAVLERCVEMVRQLIQSGADVNLAAENEMTPLILAARCGAATIAAVLVEAGADLELKDGAGESALQVAVRRREKSIAADLIKGGADVNTQNSQGATPLLWAVKEAEDGWSKFLLDAGADVHITDNDGESALLASVSCNNISLARILLEAGADPNQSTKDGKTIIDHAVDLDREEFLPLLLGKTALDLVHERCPDCRKKLESVRKFYN